MDYPQHITIIEVGPRDGLQNEAAFVSSKHKIELINLLSQSGLHHIEVTSFVSPKAIPQLADHNEVFRAIDKVPSIHYSALVPNEHGMVKALEAGAREIAVFTAASEQFNQRNINCSIDESIARFKPVLALAQENNIRVRGYISCVLGCPYQGSIPPQQVALVTQKLLDLGVDEISLGDTIGVGTPRQTHLVLDQVLKLLPLNQLAMHFHDTYGQAIANIYASLQHGVHRFDSSVAGLGGCPYALGASGNVATEDVLYLMHGLGIETGIDIFKIVAAGDMICKILGRKNQSKVANAMLPTSCN
ncbi:hydroxymethylglutaryl-CoA lyase [Legionella longbeachae]|uniref:hydroxymethylglutaryl-CoA lyase n=1 Tax=Legionella longbeachae serogroup 1 (strain NSW150) TaxID=661367 RepID=D3HR98_LEGLN|nr:hydroxymethylglutaryl-CoA lyase [Legionella longbeachae]VEE01934.1 Hydroxymethylglutaryl-CoA lyase (HMG-CoA lyase) (HL) (3-hydroxy-3-methylglutarate-CoA lyase) [Legionella oakridgensis]HBD7396814.1 hydroxymethylglutaryl-CoA lyase [Legionella pneumophila]ARB91751.1 hydroxymethylglutaryl-CoA lyase [Legionella longbeachae]ARM35104.1 hydroxymethylglutaryl-CoA lyase [Legionella longbeachae]EEZ95462.1 hydroxymethylglutaryl-CoA lyase [Legionella longbeachae D-4968]